MEPPPCNSAIAFSNSCCASAGSVAWAAVIHVPVTLETYGIRGALKRMERALSVSAAATGNIMGE